MAMVRLDLADIGMILAKACEGNPDAPALERVAKRATAKVQPVVVNITSSEWKAVARNMPSDW